MRTLIETYIDLTYMGSRKREDLLVNWEHGDLERWLNAGGERQGREQRKM